MDPEGWWVAMSLMGEGLAQLQKDAQLGPAAIPGRESFIPTPDAKL